MLNAARALISVFSATVLLSVGVVASADTVVNGPVFGISTAPNGNIVVADASSGVLTIRNGAVIRSIDLPGLTDVDSIGGGSMWALAGAGGEPTADTGQALYRVSNGKARQLVNLFEFEATENPDGNDPFDSNPFDVESLGGDSALVVDAGGNDLLEVDNQGNVSVVAVFPDELVSTANIKELVGCPEPSPFDFACGLPAMFPGQAVPTSVAVGPDGYYYVGELKGFPAPTGESNIWRVAPGASWAECGSSPDCVKVFDGGFTSIIDLQFGVDGQLYVAELDEASWASVELLGQVTGGTINKCDVTSLDCEVVADGIPVLTSITFGKDGSLWATRNALNPGSAEVFNVLP